MQGRLTPFERRALHAFEETILRRDEERARKAHALKVIALKARSRKAREKAVLKAREKAIKAREKANRKFHARQVAIWEKYLARKERKERAREERRERAREENMRSLLSSPEKYTIHKVRWILSYSDFTKVPYL